VSDRASRDGSGRRAGSARIVRQDIVTAWGPGVEACWNGLLTSRPAFREVDRFDTRAFQAHHAALIPGLAPAADESLVWQMLGPLLTPLAGALPARTLLLLATTTGEVDGLERHCLGRRPAPDPWASRLTGLLERVTAFLGLTDGSVISSACASSSVALAHAAALVTAGEREAVLVVACDAVTEFVFAGFTALMALDPAGARPFDRNRKGLTLGEAAGYMLVMGDAAATRAGCRSLGRLAGWGISGDANHMTGPSRDGSGLARAIGQALDRACLAPEAIGSICAHGTGTPYNDAMEMKAFRRIFADRARPLYSVKGSIGHTLGAAGLVELAVALASLRAGLAPPSANLREIDPEAEGWARVEATPAPGMRAVLSTNSGFGGINSALIVTP
jgi:3-oxoacyl-[acyl-carrier-protein] synthase II